VAEHLTVEGDLAVYALARKSPLVMRLAEVAGSCIFARSA
jgi:hypothetical protein